MSEFPTEVTCTNCGSPNFVVQVKGLQSGRVETARGEYESPSFLAEETYQIEGIVFDDDGNELVWCRECDLRHALTNDGIEPRREGGE